MADKTNRVERIKHRDNRNMDEIRAIISTQVSDQQSIDAADDIIENNNNINTLDIQVQKLHKKYLTIASAAK
jgi:dephospho-CoA kinase